MFNLKSEEDFLRSLEEKFQDCVTARQNFEKQWYLNLAFYFGRQWVQWTDGAIYQNIRLYEPYAPPWRVRLVSNKIRPAIRNELAKLTREQPQSFVMPASKDDEDLMAAKVADKITRSYFDLIQFNGVRRRATFWALLTGTGFIKTYWDANQKDPYEIEGKICITDVSPFQVFAPNLQAELLSDQPIVYHAVARDTDWVNDTWKPKKPVVPDTMTTAGHLEQKLMAVMGVTEKGVINKTYVKEAWIKPCGQFPVGKVVTYSGQNLLMAEDWPVEYVDYPFAKISHVPTGRFYADSIINDMIPLQREYNRTRSQIIEAKNRMAKPQLRAVQGSIDAKKITSEPGLVVFYRPGMPPPEPLPLQNLPGYVIQELDRTTQDMDDVSGQYEITKGRTPPGVEAAAAIAYLQEENDSRLFHTTASIEEALESVGRQFLSLVHSRWDVSRMVVITGKDGIFESEKFKGADIRGNTAYRIQTGSTLPRSQAAKQASIMELYKLGILEDNQKALQYLGMNETDILYEESQVSVRQAQRENQLMNEMMLQPQLDEMGQPAIDPMTGQPVMMGGLPTNDFDDHAVHWDVHCRFCRSQEFSMLSQEQQQVHLQHLQQTKMRLIQELMESNAVNQGSAQQQQSPNGQTQESSYT